MTSRIEDYALIGNCESAALVSREGSIDWLCLPRFDSAACFCALLGEPGNGRWLICPAAADPGISRRYKGDTLILETTFETGEGAVCVTDFMWRRDGASDLVRIVRGLRGTVKMSTELIVRFDYGRAIPWASRGSDGRLELIAGPNRLLLDTSVEVRGVNFTTKGDFEVSAGEEANFTLSWTPSWRPQPSRFAARDAQKQAETFWCEWGAPFRAPHKWSEAVLRSLLTLKALSHHETGGIVAAATTSLPERIGGVRNWDYRYCWLRDATFTLYALLASGFLEEAGAWRQWLLRAVAGNPADLQIMYGVAGERRLPEFEIPWLAGYQGSRPVRIGNAAASQIQLDVYGEVLDVLYLARRAGLPASEASWSLECALICQLEDIWEQPDHGAWEVRGDAKHFTHSKAMAWVAFDRAVRSMEEFGLAGPIERWSSLRARIHSQICEKGFDTSLNSFVQSYGSKELDASLLLLAVVGFLPPSDSRIRGTLDAIEKKLVRDGMVRRYNTIETIDGLPPGEGAFLACSFWLADNYVLQHRYDEANDLYERLLALRNDVGLLAEEYDPVAKRQLGNFPQAFSHLALVNTARNLASAEGPARHRATGVSDREIDRQTSEASRKPESFSTQCKVGEG